MSRLSWRKQPNETGLSKICQSPRGLELWYGNKKIAIVSHSINGWHFYTMTRDFNIPAYNSFADGLIFNTKEEAKEAANTFVKKYFVKG